MKADPVTQSVAIVLLSGSVSDLAFAGESGAADAYLRKPFSPLELLDVVERLTGSVEAVPPPLAGERKGDEHQLLLYARDLRHLLEIERGQRALLQDAYQETVAALASALESKDTGTRAHSQRVQRYALELARKVSPDLIDDPSIECGFLLHDVGKIGIPDRILQKPGRSTRERPGSCGRTHSSASRCSAVWPSSAAKGSTSCARITSAGTGAAIPTESRAPTSRLRRGSSPSPTRSTP